jgi:hypothetical protein
MTPKKQVSPAIRILRGERDASARATHLEAATRKFLVTTNERKYMSTKTNFKRIALVAVAALGMGVLSSVPSQATFLTQPTLAVTAGTATKAKADSSTAGTLTVTFNSDGATDSVVLTSSSLTRPALATNVPGLNVFFGDTVGSTGAVATPEGRQTASGLFTVGVAATPKMIPERGDSITMSAGNAVILTSVAAQNVMKLKPQIDTTTGTSARFAGTYTWLISATPYSAGVKGTPVSATYTITIAALDSESEVASSGTSKAFMSSSGTVAPTVDASISALATASTDIRGYVYVNLLNTESAQAVESVTLTTTIGSFGANGGASAIGKNVTLKYDSGAANYYPIFSDGTAGTAVITVKSESVTFTNKAITFYAATPATLVASVLNSVPGVGTTSAAVAVVPKDSNGNLWGGSLKIYSNTLGTISDTGTACVNNLAAAGVYVCPVTGVIAGAASVTVRDATLAVVSNAVSLTVSAGTAATVKLVWDKASYAPGEKATLAVQVLDSTGKAVSAGVFANLFAAGGISLSSAAGNGSDTLTAISVTTSSPAAGAIGTSTEPQKLYTVYMPAAGATIKATATGGSSLPAAGQVAVSASATVTDSGAAALAAVTALATTVASLKTLITTLTNLVLKIQKKVKA